MKKTKITLFFVCLLTLILFLIINKMTVSPGTTSGNGNPALLIAFLLIPLLFLMIILWIRIFKIHFIAMKFLMVGMCVIIIHWVIALTYQMKEFENYREVIKNALIEKDGIVSSTYLHDITSGFSIHVNNQYFNWNTFFMFLTFSIFAASCYCIWQRLEEARAKRKQ